MHSRYAALVVFVVGRKILLADLVIKAMAARPPDCRDDKIADRDLADIRTNLYHASEILMSEHEKIEAGRRDAVFAAIYLAIGATGSDAEHFDQHAAAFRHIRNRWLFHFNEVHRIYLLWRDGDSFHIFLRISSLSNNRVGFWRSDLAAS